MEKRYYFKNNIAYLLLLTVIVISYAEKFRKKGNIFEAKMFLQLTIFFLQIFQCSRILSKFLARFMAITGNLIKVAENSFQYFPRLTV